MYGNVKRDERRRIRKSGQRQVTAQETDNIKRRKSFFLLGWHGHIERINNKRIPKQIVTARMECIR